MARCLIHWRRCYEQFMFLSTAYRAWQPLHSISLHQIWQNIGQSLALPVRVLYFRYFTSFRNQAGQGLNIDTKFRTFDPVKFTGGMGEMYQPVLRVPTTINPLTCFWWDATRSSGCVKQRKDRGKTLPVGLLNNGNYNSLPVGIMICTLQTTLAEKHYFTCQLRKKSQQVCIL